MKFDLIISNPPYNKGIDLKILETKKTSMTELERIETRFLEVTGLTQDLTLFPITENVKQPRRRENDRLGEVFTPLSLVDRMITTSLPKPDAFTMDLCAGQGQFTVRILRYHLNNDPSFDVSRYLREFHWFNEINPVNIEALLHIFGPDINLAAGDATKLGLYPEVEGVWKRGRLDWDGKTWVSKKTQLF